MGRYARFVSKAGAMDFERVVQTVVGNLQEWRGAVPRIKTFFGDSDVYMKLFKEVYNIGKK